MAFSLRKMLSNYYFSKHDENKNSIGAQSNHKVNETQNSPPSDDPIEHLDFEHTEPDSTSKQPTLKLPETFNPKKGSLSDTDLLTSFKNIDKKAKKEKRKAKKLKLDIEKASKSFDDDITCSDNSNDVENTPKHILLECKSSDAFSERFKKLDFNKSIDLFNQLTDESSFEEKNLDIESLSDSDSISITSESNAPVKMCRKVDDAETEDSDHQIILSATPESFGDVEIDSNEGDRITLLLNYQMKLEKMGAFLRKILNEFGFHIEVSKILNCKSIVTALPGTDVNQIPEVYGHVKYIDNIDRGVSPTGSWNIIVEKEDDSNKIKLKKQLLAMKSEIDEFVNNYLKIQRKHSNLYQKQFLSKNLREGKRTKQTKHINNKKKLKNYDFPDFRDAFMNLFKESNDLDTETNSMNTTTSSEYDESDCLKCICRCHGHSTSQTDSGLTSKSNERSMSITSSIGNFSLDMSTLTAYSESLDLIISYNSFQDTSLFSMLLQKPAIERITFYIQVHSIQLKCELSDQEYDSKNIIKFHCPACNITETEENGLLKHILSQTHCEKLHFLYKTAYIKKCVQTGKEIQPSTVLNPMKMYRDDNKIVCFGDAVYACSLCFENMIVGESVLMAHCSDPDHVERREKLVDLFQ